MPETATQLAPDKRQFGRYTLLYRFATGGMADIYLARLTGEAGFEKLVAVKVIHELLSRQPEFIEMFIDEARLASRISHPNVVHTLELGRVGDAHFIAMEYVEGENLNALIRRKRASTAICARVLADAAAGLHAAHELRGKDGTLLEVVHRDVSPSNILVSYSGAVKVVDFGVARARGRLHATRSGSVKGKFAYMAPEQLSRGPVDRRADVFALGILLYEMTTRRHLFKMSDDGATVGEVLHGTIVPPSELEGLDDYPERLEAIVMRALQRDRDQRYQTAHELQQALERFIVQSGEPVLQADVGQLMQQTFGDRIVEKKELLQQVEQAADVVPEVELASGTSMGLEGRARRSQRRRLYLVLGLGLVIAVCLVVVLLVAPWRKEPATRAAAPASPDASAATAGAPPTDAGVPAADTAVAQAARKAQARPAPKQPEPAKVSFDISATPKEASILVNGNSVGNPCHLERPVGEGLVEVVISAENHQSHRFFASLAEGGKWEIALKPKVRSPPDEKRGKIGGSKGSKKHRLGNKDVLVNPYR